jgi:hypothetical protein
MKDDGNRSDEMKEDNPYRLAEGSVEPKLLEPTIGRAILVFFVSWFLVSMVVGIVIPMDPTGDATVDQQPTFSELLLGIAVIGAAIGLAVLDAVQCRRLKKTRNRRG